MRLLVCGGRDFKDQARLNKALDAIHARNTVKVIIQGGQRTKDPLGRKDWGADYFAKVWAEANGIECIEFAADWSIGRRAGPIRNQRMIDVGQPTHVLGFEGGDGTKDMLRKADQAGIRWHHFKKPKPQF